MQNQLQNNTRDDWATGEYIIDGFIFFLPRSVYSPADAAAEAAGPHNRHCHRKKRMSSACKKIKTTPRSPNIKYSKRMQYTKKSCGDLTMSASGEWITRLYGAAVLITVVGFMKQALNIATTLPTIAGLKACAPQLPGSTINPLTTFLRVYINRDPSTAPKRLSVSLCTLL